MRILLFQAVLILTAVTSGGVGQAQNDLFDSPDAGVFGEAATTEASAGEELQESPLVQQFIEHAGRGNVQLAESLSSLARIGRWSVVDRLLRAAAARNISAAEMVEMARRIEPAVMMRITLREGLSDQAREVIEKISQAATAQAESPDRLRTAIDNLDADSFDTRLAATRTLLAGGYVAVTELVAAAVSPNPPAPRDDILRILLRLGDGGPAALRQLALYGQPTVRLHAVESLARLDRSTSMIELVTALHAADSTDAEIASAEAILSRRSVAIPSRQRSVAALSGELERLRSIARQMDNGDQVTTLWNVNDARTGVTHQQARRIMAAYRDAADMAARLRRIGDLSPDVNGAVLIADMGYRLMVDPDWGDAEQVEAVKLAFGTAVVGESLLAAIREAMQSDDQPALVGLLRLIDPDASDLQRHVLLRSNGPLPTPLVAAASSPEPRVRYESALAISRLAGNLPFAGSSQVKRCLSEMRSLKDQPTAILVETRTDVIVRQETVLATLGYNVELVGTVAQLQRVVSSGGDLRMILSKTELADLPVIEMIDLVRRIDRGREIPIVLYGAEVSGLDSTRWDAPAVLIDRPASPAAFAEVIDRIERRRRLPPLSAIDRQLYRSLAGELLTELAQAR